MDSLKVTGLSTSLGFVYLTDLLSGVLMCVMFAVQIYYLYLKTKKIKESYYVSKTNSRRLIVR